MPALPLELIADVFQCYASQAQKSSDWLPLLQSSRSFYALALEHVYHSINGHQFLCPQFARSLVEKPQLGQLVKQLQWCIPMRMFRFPGSRDDFSTPPSLVHSQWQHQRCLDKMLQRVCLFTNLQSLSISFKLDLSSLNSTLPHDARFHIELDCLPKLSHISSRSMSAVSILECDFGLPHTELWKMGSEEVYFVRQDLEMIEGLLLRGTVQHFGLTGADSDHLSSLSQYHNTISSLAFTHPYPHEMEEGNTHIGNIIKRCAGLQRLALQFARDSTTLHDIVEEILLCQPLESLTHLDISGLRYYGSPGVSLPALFPALQSLALSLEWSASRRYNLVASIFPLNASSPYLRTIFIQCNRPYAYLEEGGNHLFKLLGHFVDHPALFPSLTECSLTGKGGQLDAAARRCGLYRPSPQEARGHHPANQYIIDDFQALLSTAPPSLSLSYHCLAANVRFDRMIKRLTGKGGCDAVADWWGYEDGDPDWETSDESDG